MKTNQEEAKKGWAPSDRITKIKTANPFGSSAKKHKTNFGYAYAAGSIPCRINHGCSFNKIQWDMDISCVDYDPVLINCFEGLLETEHPYNFVASQGARELLEAEGASDKTIPIVQKLILPLRAGLTCRDAKTWNNAMDLFKLMCEVTG